MSIDRGVANTSTRRSQTEKKSPALRFNNGDGEVTMDGRDNDNRGTTSCGVAALCTHCIPTYSPETQASIEAVLELRNDN